MHLRLHAGSALAAVGGIVASSVLLGALAVVAPLPWPAWIAGLGSAGGAGALYARGLAGSGRPWPTPADRVTLLRAVLVAGVTALVVAGFARPSATPTLVALALVALALDGVDGRVARRTRSVTPLGARLDMEVDAWLILVLSMHAVPRAGIWVLAIGLARYALLVAGWFAPWLRADMPPRYWNKVVAVIQAGALLVVATGWLPRPANQIVLVIALALLAESFGHQIAWLHAHHAGRIPAAPLVAPRARVIVLPAAIVWFALVLPDWPQAFVPGAWLRLPAAGIALLAIALVLPAKAARHFATITGGGLAALVWVKLLDLGFQQAFERPFDPLADGAYFAPAFGVLVDTFGRLAAIGIALLATAIVIAIPIVLVRACRVLVASIQATPRAATARVIGALATAWIVLAIAGLTLPNAPGPVASRAAAQLAVQRIDDVRRGLADRRVFAAMIAGDAHAGTPANCLLDGLRGKDVLLIFVESYGRTAVAGTPFAAGVDAALRRGTTALAARGFATRSAFLVSPTFGGGSWLAHATLQSGLWVDTQRRYDQLLASQRLTLARAFRAAGWRTVVDAPADTGRWPQGMLFYRFDGFYDGRNVGYRGPAFSYAPMPDQYTLLKLRQNELARQPRKPVFAEIDFVSSHHPWTPLPRLVPWDAIGDGRIFDPMPAQGLTPDEAFRHPATVQRLYGASIQYSIDALVSFLTHWPDPNLVVIALGDHQPWGIVSGPDPGHDVPVMVITRDAAVLARIAPWQWSPGLLPAPDAPVWRMSTLRDRLFDAFRGSCNAPAHAVKSADNA